MAGDLSHPQLLFGTSDSASSFLLDITTEAVVGFTLRCEVHHVTTTLCWEAIDPFEHVPGSSLFSLMLSTLSREKEDDVTRCCKRCWESQVKGMVRMN